MLLLAEVAGFQDPVPGAPAIYGYGCTPDWEAGTLACRVLSVWALPEEEPFEAVLASPKNPDGVPVRVAFLRPLERGVHHDVELALEVDLEADHPRKTPGEG